jgi:hypothetical protein
MDPNAEKGTAAERAETTLAAWKAAEATGIETAAALKVARTAHEEAVKGDRAMRWNDAAAMAAAMMSDEDGCTGGAAKEEAASLQAASLQAASLQAQEAQANVEAAQIAFTTALEACYPISADVATALASLDCRTKAQLAHEYCMCGLQAEVSNKQGLLVRLQAAPKKKKTKQSLAALKASMGKAQALLLMLQGMTLPIKEERRCRISCCRRATRATTAAAGLRPRSSSRRTRAAAAARAAALRARPPSATSRSVSPRT